MFCPGVRQAYIDAMPSLKGDRRVRNHKLAICRLQQYNCVLQVCLCPSILVIVYLLLPFYLARFPKETVHKQQTCSRILCNDHLKSQSRCRTSKNHNRAFIFIFKKHRKRNVIFRPHVHRAVIEIQLLLKAGDIELNPGPKSKFDCML